MDTNQPGNSSPSTVPIPPEIQAFLESLIQEANVPVFDDKAKEELIRYLFDKLDKFLAAKIVENMTPEDTEAFIKLNEEGKPREEIDAFIKTHMKDPQEVFTKAFVDFRDFYLTGQPGAGQNISAPAAKPADDAAQPPSMSSSTPADDTTASSNPPADDTSSDTPAGTDDSTQATDSTPPAEYTAVSTDEKVVN